MGSSAPCTTSAPSEDRSSRSRWCPWSASATRRCSPSSPACGDRLHDPPGETAEGHRTQELRCRVRPVLGRQLARVEEAGSYRGGGALRRTAARRPRPGRRAVPRRRGRRRRPDRGGRAPPVLLTGDASGPSARIGRVLGVDDVRAALLPSDEAAVVAGWRGEGRGVLAVGDGINDAPLLAPRTPDPRWGRVRERSPCRPRTACCCVTRSARSPRCLSSPGARSGSRASTWCSPRRSSLSSCPDLIGTLPVAVGVAGHELSTVLVGLNGLRLLVRPGWPPSRADRAGSDGDRAEAGARVDARVAGP